MARNKILMVVGVVLLLFCLLAEGDAQEKDNVKPVRPQTHGGGWWGGGWGGGGPGGWGGGGWGGGGHGGGWGGGGWGGGGGGWGGGGWGGGGHGGGWGGGGGCRYWCGRGRRCCTPQEIASLTGEKDIKSDTVVGTQGYSGGGGGYGGGYSGGHGGWGGWGGGGGCHRWCGKGRCCTPQEIASLTGEKDGQADMVVGTQGHGGDGGGYGGGHGGWGGWGGWGGCRRWCGKGRCCTPQEVASLTAEKDVKTDAVVGTQGHGGGSHPEVPDQEAKGKETKSTEAKADPNPVKQGEVKN